MLLLTTMITIGKEIDCGVCGLARLCVCGWSDYGRGFTVLCFDSSNLFQIKSKFEEKISIQTEEIKVVLGTWGLKTIFARQK